MLDSIESSPDQSPLILTRDEEAEARAIRILKEYPHYQLENIIFRHEPGITCVQRWHQGQEGLGFLIDQGQGLPPMFLKIFRHLTIPKVVMKEFLLKMKMPVSGLGVGDILNDKSLLKDLDYDVGNPLNESNLQYNINERQPERQAAALVMCHRLDSVHFPALKSIWTYNGLPIGYATEYIEGKPVSVEPHGNEVTSSEIFLRLKKTLNALDIRIDQFWGSNNGILTTDGTLKLVDLTFEGNLDKL